MPVITTHSYHTLADGGFSKHLPVVIGHMVTTGQPFLCPAELLPTTTQLAHKYIEYMRPEVLTTAHLAAKPLLIITLNLSGRR